MEFKKQLHKQAIVFSVVLILSWMMLAGLQAMLPAVIMIVITVFLNYCLKPDLSRYFKIHVIFGLATNIICNILLISFNFLSPFIDGSLYAKLLYLHLNLHWIIPAVLMLLEIGYYMKRRLYKKPKELAVLVASNAGICVLITYIIVLFMIGSNI